MTGFPRAILDYWHEAFDGRRVDTAGDFALTVVPTLHHKRPAMILKGQDGSTRAALTPELARMIGACSPKVTVRHSMPFTREHRSRIWRARSSNSITGPCSVASMATAGLDGSPELESRTFGSDVHKCVWPLQRGIEPA